MIILKNARDLEAMRPAGLAAAAVLNDVAAFIEPGMATRDVDLFAASRIKHYGAKSAFLGYRKYPCQICISVNEQVVHGLAGPRLLEFGDIVSLDVGVVLNGYVGDTARTVAVGGCNVAAQRLMDVTEKSLYEGIAQAVPGHRVADISRAVQTCVESNGFSVVREFVGHGVGRSVHEDPQIPNFVDGKSSEKLRPGMTIAIEPMVNAGLPGVKTLKDNWTVVTLDGSLSAHFEHTVLVTEGEPGDINMARTDAIEVEGVVVEALRQALYRVELANGHQVLGHFKSRNRLNPARFAPGDRVTMEMSPFDLSKGRILIENERTT